MPVSTLGYALLTRLARKPHSGYELLQALKRPIGFFWQASQSQIYPELKRLEVLGLVSFEVVELATYLGHLYFKGIMACFKKYGQV